MREYNNESTVWEDIENLKVVVNDPDQGKFEIVGFESASQMRIFVDFGDFENSKNNDFYVCTGSNIKLIWKQLER
jgi:hypothetical protein